MFKADLSYGFPVGTDIDMVTPNQISEITETFERLRTYMATHIENPDGELDNDITPNHEKFLYHLPGGISASLELEYSKRPPRKFSFKESMVPYRASIKLRSDSPLTEVVDGILKEAPKLTPVR